MIAFLSNTNIEPLKIFFKEKTYSVGFNQYILSLLDEKSKLYSKEIDHVLLFIDGEEFLKDLLYEQLPSKELLHQANERMMELLNTIEKYISKRSDVCFFINNITLPVYSISTYVKNIEPSFLEIELALNQKIKKFSEKNHNLLVIDWQSIVKSRGYYNLYDDKFWYLGRIRLNNKAFSLIAENYQNLINAYHGKTKKVLVLDLDNTLWGGVIGEEGIQGLQLSEEGQGKIYRDFQKIIKSLKQIGVLLCINSKNNAKDVDFVFKNHPMMVLNSDDFIIKKLNWNDKVTNMKEIAQELNLGLDSFVFIDDNPAERDYVRKNLPEVSIPEFPHDITTLKTWFFESIVFKYFSKIHLGEEDRLKTKQYKIKIQRDHLSRNLNVEDFIKSLEIKLKIYSNPIQYISRISQLTQKTNQFNLTTKRYTEREIEGFFNTKDAQVFALEYEDKFGKEGLIGVAIFRTNLAQKETLLDTFLLSCRVIGKNVEYAFLYETLKKIQNAHTGLSRVKIEFIPTEKNIVAKTFYDYLPLKSSVSLINPILKKLKDKRKPIDPY